MSVNIPQLTIEVEEDGTVLLEQEWCGNTDRIQLHPIHIRHLAELTGLRWPVSVKGGTSSLLTGAACEPPLATVATPTSRASDNGYHATAGGQLTTEQLAESYFAQP